MAETFDSLESSLQEGDVRVTRHSITSEYANDSIPADAFQEMEIEIPLRGEEIIVRKLPVVREAVVITKYVEERVVQVAERYKHETLSIDDAAIPHASIETR